MGPFPGSSPTTSTSNTDLWAVGQQDLSGSSCKPSPSTELISSCEHQARTPFLLLDSSLALSNRPSVQWNKAGNRCGRKANKPPLPLCWAQLGQVPRSGSFCGCLSSTDKLGGKCSPWSGADGQGRGCSGCFNARLALPANIKTWPQFLLDLWSTKDLKQIWVSLLCEAEPIKVHNWPY